MSASHSLGYASTCATARVVDNLALYGYTPNADEPDCRPIPEPEDLTALVDGLFNALALPLANTALEPDTADLLWSMVDLFHRKLDRVQRFLDENETRQRESQLEQDGSEIQSVQLERLLDKGQLLLNKRAAFEAMRDAAAEAYETHTGSAWRPRSGSMVNHKAMTAAVVDSRDFISARRHADTTVLLPKGTKIAFTGGVDCNDHLKIWATLDKVFARHPDMVLIHGGTDRGAECIAAKWAAARKVTAVAFRPDWKKDGKAAPFKRNDRMLDILPAGVVAFPGNGINDNLVDKARKLGIAILDARSS